MLGGGPNWDSEGQQDRGVGQRLEARKARKARRAARRQDEARPKQGARLAVVNVLESHSWSKRTGSGPAGGL